MTWNHRSNRSGTRAALARAVGGVLCSAVLLLSSRAFAAPEGPSWQERYESARRHLLDGESLVAEAAFLSLAEDAPSEPERRLAIELARVAKHWANTDAAAWSAIDRGTPSASRPTRTRDEITLLYASSFLYGAGTGAWFLLQAQPDTALTATLPFIGITAAPIVTLALIDGNAPLPEGVPHGISIGTYLGFGEGVIAATYQHARARRSASGGSPEREWVAEEVSSVLWGGATLGGIAGGAIATSLPTTPGRVSFVGSLALWSGVVTGFAVSAAAPSEKFRSEHAILAGGIAYNAGIVGGMMAASTVSPSVTRVRLVDLAGVAGGLALGGTYLALAPNADSRITLATTAAGSAAGLTVGWLATRGMRSEPGRGQPAAIVWQPTIIPSAGGAQLGVTGAM